MPSKYCIFNGELVEAEKGCISPYDRGFMLGDGVFDTMSAPKGVPFLFDEHMARLFDNMKKLEITLPYASKDLHGMISKLLDENGLAGTDSYVRTTVTRGINAGGMFYPSTTPTLVIIADRVPDNLDDVRDKGVTCIVSEVPKIVASPLNEIKSLNFMWSILGMKAAHEAGADECIFFNSDGLLAECCTSNIYIIKDKVILTPPESAGLLPGVTRDYLIALLGKSGITVQKRDITRDELLSADEVFLTSSLRGVVPVSSIEGKSYATVYIREIQNLYFNSL